MSLKLKKKIVFALNLFSKPNLFVIPRKQQYCSLLFWKPPVVFKVMLWVTKDPSECGGCVVPAVLAQSFSHGHGTQGEAGADEDRVTGCPPRSQGALQKVRLPSLVQVCVPDWVSSAPQNGQLLAKKFVNVHPVTSSLPSVAYGLLSCFLEKPLSLCLEICIPVLPVVHWGACLSSLLSLCSRSHPLPSISLISASMLMSPPSVYKHAQVFKK